MAVIAISRGSRSGGKRLAECLGARLGWPVLGRELVQHAADRFDVSEAALADAMERAPRRWQRNGRRYAYVVAVQAALAEQVAAGDLVYHGLCGQLLLRGLPGVLRVRLIAPIESRIRVLREEQGLDAAAAAAEIERVDAARALWVRLMYGECINDPALYDAVLNLEFMSIPAACSTLAAMVRQPEFQAAEATRTAYSDFLLACKVKLALLLDPEARQLALEATARNGVVELTGRAPLLADGSTGDAVARIAREVDGVREVRLKLEWYDPYP